MFKTITDNELMGALKDFLSLEREQTESLSREELEAECNGWRAMLSVMPPEMVEWLVRLGEPFRVLTRKYEPKTGVLTRVVMEPCEFHLEVMEPAFDSLQGKRTVEYKSIAIPQDSVLYYEDVYNVQDYGEWEAEQDLANQSLDVGG